MKAGRGISSATAGTAIAIALLLSSLAVSPAQADDATKLAQGMMGPGMMGPMHRNMMQRMMGGALPPGVDPALLPEPHSAGARILEYYCTQCHNLPGPGMHTAAEWPQVLGRMNMRMQMMSGMMGVAAPNSAELDILLDYLQKHAQQPIDAAEFPDLNTRAGQAFGTICAQCHALPDPRQHTEQEWPAVVGRMRGHEAAMGKFVPDKTTTAEIIDFLRRHGRTRE
ncbi:hypothetical protein [Tepidiphilus thermophilus]|uniref:Cytochrome c domain-containing protein n=1 Tax=Tepidiphilus thermophilus TaxID=876478 RepID=A0A0K6IWI5_9PROT|nr:hypothetical protein [Tepidiphilus thermophilus]CUB07480.1 hypothetical protein Ga0061068_1085 [Tepidiphilus thermophilus]